MTRPVARNDGALPAPRPRAGGWGWGWRLRANRPGAGRRADTLETRGLLGGGCQQERGGGGLGEEETERRCLE